MIVATIAVDAILPALTVFGGLAAAIFTALRFNRDDATAVVNQQKILLDGMRDLNVELQQALNRAREQLIENARRIDALEKEVAALTAAINVMRRNGTDA